MTLNDWMPPLPKPINEPQLIESKLFRSLGITAFFTERHGGVSLPPYDTLNFGRGIGDDEDAVSTNMERLVDQTDLNSQPHQAKQVHGTGHLICSGQGREHPDEADILIATESNVSVAVRTADCLPILLADPVAKVIAAVHAGWRGTSRRISAHTVELMLKQGSTAENIYATLGPAIGPCCFEIDRETADRLAASSATATQAINQQGNPHADLSSINIMQLKEAGVVEKHIESNHRCTRCHPERFYSYRRDHGLTGRHLAVVVLSNGN